MQCAVIEFARNVLNLKDANSTEIPRTKAHLGREQAELEGDCGSRSRAQAAPLPRRAGAGARAAHWSPWPWYRAPSRSSPLKRTASTTMRSRAAKHSFGSLGCIMFHS